MMDRMRQGALWTLAFALCALSTMVGAQTPATPQNVSLSWVQPTTNDDGSPFVAATPITYNLYGASACAATMPLLVSGITTTSTVRLNVSIGPHCYVVTGIVGSFESNPSNQLSFTLAGPVGPPPLKKSGPPGTLTYSIGP